MTNENQEIITLNFPVAEGNCAVSVHIKNSPRATHFRLSLADKHSALLTKPSRAPKKDAIAFLNSNLAWLGSQVSEAKENISLLKYLTENPRIYVGEHEWKVWLKPTSATPFFVDDSSAQELVLAYSKNSPDQSLEETFFKFARVKILERAEIAADANNLRFSRITVRDQSSRWASRSSNGTLSFNWRIVLLPPELQNYIMCHELAHTRFMDHSLSFWIFLNRICPSAKRLDARLSKEGAAIFRISRT